jgi:hypothetical protein
MVKDFFLLGKFCFLVTQKKGLATSTNSKNDPLPPEYEEKLF